MQSYVADCIEQAQDAVIQRILQDGDSPLPFSLTYRSGTVRLTISPLIGIPPPRLSWNDTIGLLAAFSAKTSQDGYHAWSAMILHTNGGGYLGDAFLTGLEEGNLTSQPLPNPYPVPGSDITVDFEAQPDGDLNSRDARICIALAHDEIFEYLTEHGDGPVHIPLSYAYESVELDVTPLGESRITYMQTIFLLQAFSLKMNREGYKTWEAEVVRTGDTVQIADALIINFDTQAK